MSKTLTLALPEITESSQTASSPTPPIISEQDEIVNSLRHDNIAIVIASFFGFGLLLSLTPCIFPMIPILSGIIVGHNKKLSVMRGFMLSLSYVLASALTYAVFGVIAALFGSNLQAFFNKLGLLLPLVP
nr:hypothetical protein [Methylocucumis oryzae]